MLAEQREREPELGGTMMGVLYPAGSVSKMLPSKQSAIICIYMYIFTLNSIAVCVCHQQAARLSPPSTFWCIGKNNVGWRLIRIDLRRSSETETRPPFRCRCGVEEWNGMDVILQQTGRCAVCRWWLDTGSMLCSSHIFSRSASRGVPQHLPGCSTGPPVVQHFMESVLSLQLSPCVSL